MDWMGWDGAFDFSSCFGIFRPVIAMLVMYTSSTESEDRASEDVLVSTLWEREFSYKGAGLAAVMENEFH